MSTVPQGLLTPREYLEIERRAEHKSEFLGGEMFAMAGASFAHNMVSGNIIVESGSQLRDSSCSVLPGDMRVKVDATGLYTYPDVVITCDSPEFEDDEFDTLLNPLVIIEVLSDSTENYDRGRKFGHYRQVASLKEYLLVAQDEPRIERYVRQEDGSWLLTEFNGRDQTLKLVSIPVEIPMDRIYGSQA